MRGRRPMQRISNPVLERFARLDELLTLLDCPHEIAPVDAQSFGRRVGELIARSRSVHASNVRSSHLQLERPIPRQAQATQRRKMVTPNRYRGAA
jgi:hypothetical protein